MIANQKFPIDQNDHLAPLSQEDASATLDHGRENFCDMFSGLGAVFGGESSRMMVA